MRYDTAKIRPERMKRGLSVQRLAQLSHLAASTIHRLESENSEQPQAETISKIARGLGLPIQHFLTDETLQVSSEEVA